jgi:hypothetical protein
LLLQQPKLLVIRFQFRLKGVHLGIPIQQQLQNFFSLFSCIQGANTLNLLADLLHLFTQPMCLLIQPSWDMLPLGDSRSLPTLQFRKLFRHVIVKLVLPLDQLVAVAHDLFCGQAVILCQWYKTQVHMRIALIHMYHCRKNILLANLPLQKFQRSSKVSPYLLR